MSAISTSFIAADGVEIFYRSAGPVDAPVLLLLHGFPTSSFQYRNVMSLLSHKYRVIAPDMPGFGFTVVPAERKYKYTFVNLSKTIEAFVDALELTKFALYIHDYGAPTGLYLALNRPDAVTAIISQNGNAYTEGLGPGWAPINKYREDPTPENRAALLPIFTLDFIKSIYTSGVPSSLLPTLDPAGWTLDTALLKLGPNPEEHNVDIQLDLFYDYHNNVLSYPRFQALLSEKQYPLLAVWGKNDGFFVPEGAEAFKRDVPSAKVVMYDTGHFALETHVKEIAKEIEIFLG